MKRRSAAFSFLKFLIDMVRIAAALESEGSELGTATTEDLGRSLAPTKCAPTSKQLTLHVQF